MLHRITFVLSTRNANSPENRCNFPSKIIEALLHNRAVISTIHYPQLQGINYFEIPSEVDFFRERFMRIVQMDDRELAGFINQGELIYNRFNAKVWKDKMEGIENQ